LKAVSSSGGFGMKTQFTSAVVVMQLLLSALALAAVVSGTAHSSIAIACVTFCYALGLGTLVWYSATWKNKSVKDEAAIRTDKIPDDLLQANRKIGELNRELEKRRSEVWELNRFKSDFLAHISHEIRTPLNAVVGMAELLSRTDLTKEQLELVSLVNSSGETLLSVVNDILNYSKIEAGEFALEHNEFELTELVEGTTQLLAEQARLKEVTLLTFVSPKLSRSYMGDAGRLKQILLNLLGNAVRFAQSGEILVSAVADPEHQERIRFEVKDESSQMTNSIVASLFTPMTEVDMVTARKYGGTGLGLSVSKKLVELMRGKIGVDSQNGQETIYWFSALLRPAPANHDSGTEHIAISQKKIMLFGKASSSMGVVMAYCKSWGLDPEYQATPDSALNVLHATPEQFQAVIVDPSFDGGSAVAFLQKMFESEPLTNVHALVLTEDERIEQSVKKLGFTLQTLRKPFRKAHLREALRQCHMRLRRSGDLELPESHLRSVVASVGFATNPVKPSTEASPERKRKNMRILIVEDNPVNRRLVHLQLKTMGLDCDIVENGQEAVDAIEKEKFDLIFMDCWMPILDGFAATARIREIDAKRKIHTPIVAMTANALDTDRFDCLSSGMDDYISKPVTRTVLMAMLDKWIPQRGELKFDTTDDNYESPDNPPRKPRMNTNTWS